MIKVFIIYAAKILLYTCACQYQYYSRKHEYEKHGTCASSVQGFETEHDFFQMTLQLKEKYDPIRYEMRCC